MATKKKEVVEKEVDVKTEVIDRSDKPKALPIQENNKAWRVANGIQ